MSSKPVIAAQLYTLRNFLKTPADTKKTMRRVKQIGYDAAQVFAAQIYGADSMPPAELRKIMLDAGVDPIGAHVPLDQFRNNLKGVIETCHKLDIGYVAIPWLDYKTLPTPAAWKTFARECNGFGKALARDGLVLQYHNHMFEFEKFGVKNGRGGETFLDLLYKSTNPAFLQAELDLGWIARANQSPVAWVLKMAGRMDQVHLKDWGVKNDQAVWRAIGEGGICWPCVFKACKTAGTRHYIVEQDDCPITNDPFLSLAISRKNIKSMKLG